MTFTEILEKIDSYVWGIPLIVLIIVTGIILSCRTHFLQIFHLGKALKFMVKNEENGEGEVTSFGALCTALSATIGTGNIVGVATAITAGGPGALFWMIVAAFFGMATKYSEGFLAIKYRTVDENNHVLGGPFYYIERGMGKKWRWLAKIFAFFGVCVGLVIIGGISRISKVSQVVVPFMAIAYVLFAVILILCNIPQIPNAVVTVIKGAFGFGDGAQAVRAAAGGVLGAMLAAMQNGVARGIFSNESGLGSAPIAAAAAQTNDTVRQGLITMTGTFIDTIIICTMTGISIVLTGAYLQPGLEGVNITSYAFQNGLPFPHIVSSTVLTLCLIFFAFTTILGWDYYSERCLEYLSNKNLKAVKVFRWIYILAVFIGPYMTISAVWTIADIFNGLMAIPNVIALIALSGVIAKETNEYFRLKKYNSIDR